MQPRAAALFRYRVPLAPGAALREGAAGWREGLLLRLGEAGRQGWGEVAPLPGFSRESLAEAELASRQWLAHWQSGAAPTAPTVPYWPALAFGSSCALAELAGALPESADYRAVPLYGADAADLATRLRGATLGKLKLGQGRPQQEGERVGALLAALPELVLRLDANRAWTPEQAREFARGLNPAQRRRIEFFEEPCRTPAQSLAFAADTGIALAWDETLRESGCAPTVAETRQGLRALVVKPTLTGDLAHCRELIERAQALGLAAVISSSIESSLGLGQLARLAAWLTPHTRPGLDTLRMMGAQVLRPWPGVDLPLLAVEELECLWRR